MISLIDFDQSPFTAGETRSIAINGSSPISVRINCFIFKPPPPDYKPCDACGVLTLSSGEIAEIAADRDIFAEYGGELHLQIRDADGDEMEIRTKVKSLMVQMAGRVKMSEAEEA